MAVLKVKFDTTSREWEVSDLEHGTFRDEECDLNFDDLYIHWGFKNGSANSIVFDKLTFGCTITKDGVEVANITRPSSPRGSYIRTDSEFMEVDHIDTDAGSTYNLNIWVDEQGIRNEKTLEISILLEAPYRPRIASLVWCRPPDRRFFNCLELKGS